ncbi:MAG: tripartite tricarboxylate transporter substrate binding protein [Burkholderiaceae bacterium]|nr:tripartite tricarboxylate transporter substrate binding protein [Burkholderiaceae bacterium]
MSFGAHAQTPDVYPSRGITIIVPFTAAGTTDILARLVGQKLGEKFDKSVVVENRPGAGGNIGTALVAKSAPDGYTLVMATIGTHAINSSLYKSMPYDAVRDFTPLTRVAMVPNVLVVNKDAPYNTVQELIAYGKANPGKLTFGSSGNGTTLHLSGELFKLRTGVPITHIPYKGSTPAIADLLGGQISMVFDNMPSVIQHIKAGRLKALAVTSSTRNAQLPDVPTIEESGVPNYEVWSWFGLLAPAGTPAAVIDRLNREIVAIIRQPDVNTRILELGSVPKPETSAEFGAFIRAETDKWARVVKEAGVAID